MDNMNADMKQAEKHITGMEKWCGLFVCPWKRCHIALLIYFVFIYFIYVIKEHLRFVIRMPLGRSRNPIPNRVLLLKIPPKRQPPVPSQMVLISKESITMPEKMKWKRIWKLSETFWAISKTWQSIWKRKLTDSCHRLKD